MPDEVTESKTGTYTHKHTHSPHTHTPLSVQGHGGGGLQGLFLGRQEVEERAQGVRGPGYWLLIGWSSRAEGGANCSEAMHVAHGLRHQVT